MRTSFTALLILTLTLSACASRMNPMNWFGRSKQEIVVGEKNTLIPQLSGFSKKPDVYSGRLVGKVNELKVEKVPGGAIIRATVIANGHGTFDVRLTPENKDELPVNGVLSYRFEALQSRSGIASGSSQSRSIVVAHRVTDQTLQNVRSIRVLAADNAMVSRR